MGLIRWDYTLRQAVARGLGGLLMGPVVSALFAMLLAVTRNWFRPKKVRGLTNGKARKM